MSAGLHEQIRAALRHEPDALRGDWPWFVFLGIVLIAIGGIALSSMAIASLATAVALGALILVSGMAETLGAFWCRAWSGFTLHLLSGLLSIVVGIMFLRAPVGALVTLTLLVACFLIVGGAFKIIATMSYRFAAWGWPLASGLIDVVLGIMIWQEWPASSFWVIGLFVGINLVFRGFNWFGLGLSLRAIANSPSPRLGKPSVSLAPSTP